MACPKLKDGDCKATKKPCKKSYGIKMKNYKACALYKSKKGSSVKKKKVTKKKKRR
jgi:hypothetical protein